MKQRTGIEAVVFATRTCTDSFVRPYYHTTGDLPDQFFETVFNRPISDMALKLEAYCLSGVDGKQNSEANGLTNTCLTTEPGIRWNSAEEVIKKKAMCSALILQKLRKCHVLHTIHLFKHGVL